MEAKKLINFFNWLNRREELGYTDKGIEVYVKWYLDAKKENRKDT
jgi:hypothetical protein